MNIGILTADHVNKGFADTGHGRYATRYVTNTSTSGGNINCNNNPIPAGRSDHES